MDTNDDLTAHCRCERALMDTTTILLTVAFRHAINEANIETAYLRFAALAGDAGVDYEAFCDAIARCLHRGLIREPICLPDGALQCHWHLELTSRRGRSRTKSADPFA